MSWLKKFLPITEQQPQLYGFGFQVLKNPRPELAIEPWFDFIIGINGRPIEDGNALLFSQEVRNCAGRDVSFGIWSAKGQWIRDIIIPLPSDATGLGITLQWAPLAVTEDIWHILEVQPNSPADIAGLLPYGDYIIGTPEGTVRGESGLGELVEDHMDRPLRLYVYNHEYDITRPLTITPRRNWGGDGALGCVLGFGALHRLPAALTESPPAPGETIFDSTLPTPQAYSPQISQQYYAPAPHFPSPSTPPTFTAYTPPPPPPAQPFTAYTPPAPPQTFAYPPQAQAYTPPPPKGPRNKSRHAHHVMNISAMDDYMREGEQISLALDQPTSRAHSPAHGGAGIPPPPQSKRESLPPPPRRVQTPIMVESRLRGGVGSGGHEDDID
ncbi:hypothetical protein RUND412_010817 [Rhizina undulata]